MEEGVACGMRIRKVRLGISLRQTETPPDLSDPKQGSAAVKPECGLQLTLSGLVY